MPSDDEDAAELITRDDDAADANNSTPPTPGPSKDTHLRCHRAARFVSAPPAAAAARFAALSIFGALDLNF